MTPEPRSGVEEWIHHTQTLTADTDGYIFDLKFVLLRTRQKELLSISDLKLIQIIICVNIS